MKKLTTILTAFICLTVTAQQHYPLKNFFGVNCHAWDIDSVNYPAKYKAFVDAGFSFIRVYSDIYANKDTSNGFALNPDLRGFWQDSALHSLKRDLPHLKTILCYQNQSKPIQSTWPQGSTIDRPYLLNANDSASYSELRRDAYVLASRGGTNKNATDYKVYNSPYWWEPRQVMYKGAGFYDILELMNEPDMEYTFGKLSGTQVAIANSATYSGAKAADPNITVSSSGLADQLVSKFDSIAAWADKYNGSKLPFDIYQNHAYNFAWDFGMAGGIPPEYESNNNAVIVAQHAAKYNVAPFLGEYGYDRADRSYLAARAKSTRQKPIDYKGAKFSNGQYTQDQSQAFLSLRQVLGAAMAGYCGATYYRAFYDYNINANDSNENLFASTAFFKDVNQDNKIIQRRLNCEYQKQMKDKFGDYSYRDFARNDTVKVWNFVNGTQQVQPAWTYEKLSSWNDNGTTRPLLIERRVDYYFPNGTIYKYDSLGILQPEHHTAGNYTLTSVPVFFVADNLAPLPILSFSAKKQGNCALLKWQADESVDVQRSADGVNWVTIASSVKGSQLLDCSVVNGMNFYRLKASSYSSVQMVFFGKQKMTVKVMNALGQTLLIKQIDDVDGFERRLPHSQLLILSYYNDKRFFTKKYYEVN